MTVVEATELFASIPDGLSGHRSRVLFFFFSPKINSFLRLVVRMYILCLSGVVTVAEANWSVLRPFLRCFLVTVLAQEFVSTYV